jgi:hypothetical protein
LDPSGYVYKRFPEDFQENYISFRSINIKGIAIPYRMVIKPGEGERESVLWSRDNLARERTPQPDFDPDNWLAIRTSWRDARAFQKVALKPATAAWEDDK